jgi:hypothetical protein
MKAAEERVAELEAILKREGIPDEGRNRWRELHTSQPSIPSEPNETSASPAQRRPPKRLCIDIGESPRHDNEADMEWDDGSKRKDVNAVVDILRDLSLEAGGGYIGASSSITMSRMVGSLVKSKMEPGLVGLRPEEHLSPKSSSDGGIDVDGTLELGSMPADIADKLLRGYLKHISTRWPILHSTYIRELHSRRGALGNSYEKSVLHLMYANGARYLETTGETGAIFPDRHHSASMQYLDEMLQYHDIRSVQMLILLAIYSLRAPKGPGAW